MLVMFSSAVPQVLLLARLRRVRWTLTQPWTPGKKHLCCIQHRLLHRLLWSHILNSSLSLSKWKCDLCLHVHLFVPQAGLLLLRGACRLKWQRQQRLPGCQPNMFQRPPTHQQVTFPCTRSVHAARPTVVLLRLFEHPSARCQVWQTRPLLASLPLHHSLFLTIPQQEPGQRINSSLVRVRLHGQIDPGHLNQARQPVAGLGLPHLCQPRRATLLPPQRFQGRAL